MDTRDLQIVKTFGKSVGYASKGQGGSEQQFPSYAMYREQIDGKYWFPTYARAKEVLHFPGTKHGPAQDIGIRITVKWTNYQRGNVSVTEKPGQVKEEQPKK